MKKLESRGCPLPRSAASRDHRMERSDRRPLLLVIAPPDTEMVSADGQAYCAQGVEATDEPETLSLEDEYLPCAEDREPRRRGSGSGRDDAPLRAHAERGLPPAPTVALNSRRDEERGDGAENDHVADEQVCAEREAQGGYSFC